MAPIVEHLAGGTGLRPVVPGVSPGTIEWRTMAPMTAEIQQWMTAHEIRRDAGFDGRDVHSTSLKTTLGHI